MSTTISAAVAGSTSPSSATSVPLTHISVFPVIAFGAGVQRHFPDTFPDRARVVVVRTVEVLQSAAAFVKRFRDNVGEILGQVFPTIHRLSVTGESRHRR